MKSCGGHWRIFGPQPDPKALLSCEPSAAKPQARIDFSPYAPFSVPRLRCTSGPTSSVPQAATSPVSPCSDTGVGRRTPHLCGKSKEVLAAVLRPLPLLPLLPARGSSWCTPSLGVMPGSSWVGRRHPPQPLSAHGSGRRGGRGERCMGNNRCF